MTLHVRDVGAGSPEGTCGLGGQVVMGISIEGAQELSALQFEFHFDQDVATVLAGGVSSGTDIPGGRLLMPNPNAAGKLVIGMVGTTPPNVDSFTVNHVGTHHCRLLCFLGPHQRVPTFESTFQPPHPISPPCPSTGMASGDCQGRFPGWQGRVPPRAYAELPAGCEAFGDAPGQRGSSDWYPRSMA